ncbi:unnamed protein product [Psylliodes chrysocephalus]|uniref:Uncharacterized protein n=1 Tax=Psylliodes chrysocephalus TaxID=3402493 RepID=A0A9P0DB41_9CUCU|nr:unnamed protein product [Psylliodes chrysocephala]
MISKFTTNRARDFKDFIGYYMCNSCERAIYLGRKPGIPENPCEKPVNNNSSVDATDPEVDEIKDDNKKDPTFKCNAVDNRLKIDNVNKLLSEFGEPPIKLRRVSSVSECKKAISTSVKKLSGSENNNNNPNEVLMNNFKSAFNQTTSRSERIQVLSTLPLDWPIKLIRREFNISKRMVQAAKNIRKKSGFATEIVEAKYTKEEFFNELKNKWSELLKHDFVAKSQASYFSKQKESVEVGEFIVCLDFSENYSFFVQDAIQSHHWSNDQATLHPYVAYYKENGEMKHGNFVMISEKLSHDASSVHLFNTKLIEFLKNKFGADNVKKIKYFSDGAASQYKNKYNFANLINHKNYFAVEAEWNFFATSHGKGACDGLAVSVKRQAYRASLQRDNNKHITTPLSLFQWAESYFKKINFAFCYQKDHDVHEQKYQQRFERTVTIKNTRQFHYYKPLNDVSLQYKTLNSTANDEALPLNHAVMSMDSTNLEPQDKTPAPEANYGTVPPEHAVRLIDSANIKSPPYLHLKETLTYFNDQASKTYVEKYFSTRQATLTAMYIVKYHPKFVRTTLWFQK